MSSTEDNNAMQSLKYEPKKGQFLDYVIKHPARQTIFADLLLEVNLKESETLDNQSNKRKLLIPTYKKFMMQQIPHFNSMFKEGSNWREAEDDTPVPIECPDEVSADTIFKYIQRKFSLLECNSVSHSFNCSWKKSDEPNDFLKFPLTRFQFTKENIIEFLILADYWNDEAVRVEVLEFIDKNMDVDAMFKICFEYPSTHKFLKEKVKARMVCAPAKISFSDHKTISVPDLAKATFKFGVPESLDDREKHTDSTYTNGARKTVQGTRRTTTSDNIKNVDEPKGISKFGATSGTNKLLPSQDSKFWDPKNDRSGGFTFGKLSNDAPVFGKK